MDQSFFTRNYNQKTATMRPKQKSTTQPKNEDYITTNTLLWWYKNAKYSDENNDTFSLKINKFGKIINLNSMYRDPLDYGYNVDAIFDEFENATKINLIEFAHTKNFLTNAPHYFYRKDVQKIINKINNMKYNAFE